MRFSTPTLPTPPSWQDQDAWLNTTEGQLAIDMFREDGFLVIRAPMAGVEQEDIDIAMHGDLLTIRGKRENKHTIHEDDWFYRECYWGSFSRSIVLPIDVDTSKTDAVLKDGVLTIRLPLLSGAERVPVRTIS